MAVITICRSYATGGRKLGRWLARKLNYHYVDKSYFQQIAEQLHVSAGTLESFEQGGHYRLTNLFANFFSKHYIERIVGHDKTVVAEREYQKALENLVLGVAERDNVVIVGRAAYFFLQKMEHCYRFRLVASKQWRRRYAVEVLGVSRSEVDRVLEEKDRNHFWFLRTICGKGFDDPGFFHLVLNRDLIPFEQAAQLLLSVVNQAGFGR